MLLATPISLWDAYHIPHFQTYSELLCVVAHIRPAILGWRWRPDLERWNDLLHVLVLLILRGYDSDLMGL